MKAQKKSNYQHSYINYILQSLHIQMEDFIDAIVNEKCYEIQIYRWIIMLQDKGKTKEQALQIIFRARIILLLGRL